MSNVQSASESPLPSRTTTRAPNVRASGPHTFAVLSGAGLTATLVVSGAAHLARAPAALAAAHRFAGAALLLVLVGGIAYAYARGVYRERPLVWLGLVGALALLLALTATGSALRAGAEGAEGRAHVGAALFTAPPARDVVLAAHALVIAPALLGCALALARVAEPVAWRRPAAVLVVLAAAAAPVIAGALAGPAPATPEVEGASVARAPWSLRALEPLEAAWGVPVGIAAGGLTILAVAFLPLADRGNAPAWCRPVVTGVLLTVTVGYAALSVVSGTGPALAQPVLPMGVWP